MTIRSLVAFLFCQGYSLLYLAQSTSVEGRIFDGETGKPLPFVTVSFKGGWESSHWYQKRSRGYQIQPGIMEDNL